MGIKNTLVMIPDHCSSSSRRKTGRSNRPIGVEDAGMILKAFEGWQVDLCSVIHDIVAFMAIRILAFFLRPETGNKLVGEVSSHAWTAAHR
jgi:hypothetical protein